jgi:hypothetical protein
MQSITVTEAKGGWLATDGRKWPTAADAERAIRTSAPEGVLLIHWEANTAIGRAVIKAVAG